MEYEKKYRETLERASIAYKDEDRHLKATLERIFPELCESEDERIRKWLIAQLELKSDIKNPRDLELMILKSITWLEKQGKQVLVWNEEDEFIPKFQVRDKLISTKNPRLTYEILEVGHINELGNPEYKVEIFTDGKSQNPSNIHYMECCKVDEWAKLIEQKPTWSEEDEKISEDIIRVFNGEISFTSEKENKKYIDWLKSLKEKIGG